MPLRFLPVYFRHLKKPTGVVFDTSESLGNRTGVVFDTSGAVFKATEVSFIDHTYITTPHLFHSQPWGQ